MILAFYHCWLLKGNWLKAFAPIGAVWMPFTEHLDILFLGTDLNSARH